MTRKPTYEELEQRVKELEKESVERRSLEHALRESQKRLELAVDGANLAMWDWNVDTGKVEYSHRWSEILGYSPEEIKPHVSAWEELVHPEDMPQVMKKVNANLEGLTSFYECEHRLKTKSGDWRWVLARGKVVERDKDGKPLQHTGTQFDINDRVIAQEALKETRDALEQKVAERTAELVNANELLKQEIIERIQAKEALRESEEQYRELANSLPQIVYEMDANGLITFANRNAFDFFGYTQDDFDKGVTALQMLIPEDRDIALKNIQRRLRGEELGSQEYTALRKDGVTFPISVHVTPVIRDNAPIGLRGIMIDITDRKEAEEALRESEEKYRSIFENAIEGFFQSTPEGRFVSVNPAFAKMFGYASPEELVSNISDIEKQYYVDPEDRHRYQQLLQQAGSVEDFEFKARRKDGSQIWVSNSTRAYFDEEGKVGRYEGIVTDISERKRAVEEKEALQFQLIQAHKMESIGNLAGGIAHDFNNILSSILGYTELAIDDVEKGTQLENNLQEVYTAGERARDLIKQILAFARQTDEELKPIRIDKIAMEVLKLIRSTIPATIEIKQKIESDSLIMGSPTQVHQIFVNMCTNAAQAMDDTGGILEVGLVDVQLDDNSLLTQSGLKAGNYLKATISDTGPGIAPDMVDSIFEPYFTTKGIGEGTGMGLAMVHGIVEGHGGKVTVETELDKGTVFSIFLPITKKRDFYKPYEKEDLPLGTERILLVDDELPIAKMSGLILERLGYRVIIRTSSVKALELFRSRLSDFDLIITDMTMPNMTGDVLAMELIALRSDIPVILCTGYSKKISDERASQIGIKAFAYKPMVKADLAKTVWKVLDETKS